MPVVEARYVVEGWGVGELWSRDGVVLAHEFRFDVDDVAEAARARVGPGAGRRPPIGGASPPVATLAAIGQQRGHVSESIQPRQAPVRDASVLPERVAAFLGGDDVGFGDVELDLEGCTPFEVALTEALRAVPRGAVVTYGELAALAGRPGAQRAAGSFCSRNRFAFIVPCHRVVAADGIGGYGSTGVGVKRRLLELEGAWP